MNDEDEDDEDEPLRPPPRLDEVDEVTMDDGAAGAAPFDECTDTHEYCGFCAEDDDEDEDASNAGGSGATPSAAYKYGSVSAALRWRPSSWQHSAT